MTTSNNFTNLPRAIAILTAGVFLIAATEGAFAKNHGNGNSNHSNSSSDRSNRSDKHSDKKKDKEKYAEKKKKKDPVTTTANNPSAPGTGGKNNIHPIINKEATQTLTISNGVSKQTLTVGPGQFNVSSSKPGTITVSDGKNSVTLPGGSVTLSGGVLGTSAVSSTAGLQQIRLPNGDVSVAIKAPAPPSVTVTGDSIKTSGSDSIKIPAGTTIVRDHRDGKDPGVSITKNADGSYTAHATDSNKGIVGTVIDGAKSVGNGIEKGLDKVFGGVGEVPITSTTTQQ